MPRRGVAPGRLRRRLTIAFVLVAGVSAGALAAGSFLLVRETRLRDSLDRARAEAEFDLRLAQSFGPPLDVDGLLRGFEEKKVPTVLLIGGRRIPSNPSLNPEIPADLRELVARGQLGFKRIRISQPGRGQVSYLMIGGPGPSSARGSQLYFLFSEDRLNRDLIQLRNVLLVGWAAVVVLAALVGRGLARRTLEPVGRASKAARDMAEGLLATRLPVEAKDEFGAWASSFNEMADALEGKINALSEAQARERRFTSDVAHELKTPLAALVGEASLLREHLDQMPREARRPAELMVQDVGRLRRLVEDLMEISRFDAGKESVVAEHVDVPALVGAVVRSRGWADAVEFAGDLQLRTDRRRLERIVANLIGNAVEHGGSPIRVRVSRDGGAALIQVTDRGPGIPPEHLPHLFERFYKADPSRTGPGSGLGLAIARENAKLLGGDIEVWSEAEFGTRFTVRLPIDGTATLVAGSLQAGEGSVSSTPHHEAHIPPKEGDK
jgi:signal transduction histidine kinase